MAKIDIDAERDLVGKTVYRELERFKGLQVTPDMVDEMQHAAQTVLQQLYFYESTWKMWDVDIDVEYGHITITPVPPNDIRYSQ